MRLAITIMNLKPKIFLALGMIAPFLAFSQLNSPYSRYGVGNLTPQANIANRSMGGISAAVANATELNTVNPATSANLLYSTLEIGLEYNGMNLKNPQTGTNFRSHYAIIPYLQVGLPLLSGNKKAFDKQNAWSLNFGLKPMSRINYKIQDSTASPVGNLQNIYEGEGGINQAFIGTAVKLKNLSLGVSTGYLFGEKNYSNRLTFDNDSVFHYKANYESQSRFGGMFLNAGALYNIQLSKKSRLKLGAYGNLGTDYDARQNRKVETFNYDAEGGILVVDSIFESKDLKGTVTLPATFGVGFSVENERLLFGADFETTRWSDYRFYGAKDEVNDSWVMKAGVQFFPAAEGGTGGYFNYLKYRAGFKVGRDYIHLGENIPFYSISAGVGLPLKLRRSFYETQYSVMNVGFEINNRGNKENVLTESLYKVTLGFSLNDVWFRRQKYQ